MPDTLKDQLAELSQKLESAKDKLDAKIGQCVEDIAEVRNAGSIALGEVRGEIAAIQATLSSAKLIGVVGTVAISILGAVGGNQIIQSKQDLAKDRAELSNLEEKSRDLIVQHARMMKESLIDKIEINLNSEASLDNLKLKPQLVVIKRDAETLKSVNSKLPADEQSQYYKISEALDAFLDDDWNLALTILDSISGRDQAYFTYAYMKGACYLRTNRPDAAQHWFQRAGYLTQGVRVQMTLNAEGVSNLALWKALKDSNPAEADKALNAATGRFETLVESYPNFAPAFINLAGAYSASHRFQSASDALSRLRGFRTADWIATKIREDMRRESEQYYAAYLKDELGVTLSPLDPNWDNRVAARLPAGPK